tara:strand:+ start:201 stop:683 length:483 start_codon:yes stop_codon:yes gene_type:complete
LLGGGSDAEVHHIAVAAAPAVHCRKLFRREHRCGVLPFFWYHVLVLLALDNHSTGPLWPVFLCSNDRVLALHILNERWNVDIPAAKPLSEDFLYGIVVCFQVCNDAPGPASRENVGVFFAELNDRHDKGGVLVNKIVGHASSGSAQNRVFLVDIFRPKLP